jgi:hypothetical protein
MASHARPRPATGRPMPRSGAAVESQADAALDISSTPRQVGLVGRLVAEHYHVKQHTRRRVGRMAARGARTAKRTGAAHWRAHILNNERCDLKGTLCRAPAKIGAIGLERWPQHVDRVPLGPGDPDDLRKYAAEIGRARAGRHPG